MQVDVCMYGMWVDQYLSGRINVSVLNYDF